RAASRVLDTLPGPVRNRPLSYALEIEVPVALIHGLVHGTAVRSPRRGSRGSLANDFQPVQRGVPGRNVALSGVAGRKSAMQQTKWGRIVIVGCATTLVVCGVANHKQSTEEDGAEVVVQQERSYCALFGHDPFPDPSDPLWYTQDGALVKEQTGPEVYVVYGGRKWWIPSEQTLFGMNYHWEEVREVPDGTLAGLPRENVISDGP